MKKQEQLDLVLDILKTHKINNDALTLELTELLGPKAGGLSTNPPKLNDDGEIVELWCTWHKCYEPVESFAKRQTKTGYNRHCTEATKQCRLYEAEVKKLQKLTKEQMEMVLEGEISVEQAKTIKEDNDAKIAELNELKEQKVDFAK